MKWRPEWEDLDEETFSRIEKLNAFDSLTVAWLQRPEERPRLHDQMGETMYTVHQDDSRLCERIFERAAIGAEDAVREAYFALSERFSEITKPSDPPVETDESLTVAADADSRQDNANGDHTTAPPKSNVPSESERLTRERFFEITKATPGAMTHLEWTKTAEGRAEIERMIQHDREWLAENLQLTGGDGWDIERVCMELHELTGLDIFTLMEMDIDYFRKLVRAGIRKRKAGRIRVDQAKREPNQHLEKQGGPQHDALMQYVHKKRCEDVAWSRMPDAVAEKGFHRHAHGNLNKWYNAWNNPDQSV